MSAYLTTESRDGTLQISLQNDWVFTNLRQLQETLDAIVPTTERRVQFRCGGLQEFDLSGAWVLYEKSMDYEELGLRTQRIEPMINTLEDFSRRVDELKARIDEHRRHRGSPKEREPWLMEFRNILRATQETPTSLRNRVRYLKMI